MMTSIAIIVMITAIFVANYKTGNSRSDLIMTSQKLVADIHAAQNNTLGLVKYGGVFPAGGWGLNFDMSNPGQYIIFADLSQPYSNEPGQESSADYGSMMYNADQGEGDVEKGARIVTLPAGIVITSLVDDHKTLDSANVTFLPPDPKTSIYDGSETSTSLTITLHDKRENTSKTIRVNFLGLAEVID